MVLIFDSHPVQYKAPVYKAAAALAPGRFEVVYATDVSAKGYKDQGFNEVVAWNTPLLEGYAYTVLGTERGEPLTTRRSLGGRGVWKMLRQRKPRAVVMTQFRYEFDFVAYISCLLLGIPVWIRQETQDEMYGKSRAGWQSLVRYLLYRILYFPVQRAFCFGELNREHLVKHGISPERLRMARFSVSNPYEGVSSEELALRRHRKRLERGISEDRLVVAFFGKLIPKKNPDLLLDAAGAMKDDNRKNVELLFVGAGSMADNLRERTAKLLEIGGPRAQFTGFVNQQELPDYYLAADIVVLPSRRMGEAWGLVVNEALQAGCSVVITDAVGCYREFGDWERVRVINVGDALALAASIENLSKVSRSLDWANERMKDYSNDAAASALAREL